jgi:hypothetical protein
LCIKKTAEALLDASKEVGLEENTGKPKYMFMSRHQTTGKNQKKYSRGKMAEICFENVLSS